VLEQEVSRGNFHPFKERKGQRPLRSEQLKLKRIKTCTRSAPGQHLSKVLRDSMKACQDSHLKACQAQEKSTEKLRIDSTFAHRAIAARSAEVGETFQGFTVPKLRRRSIPRMQARPRL
jgi:hypothetical protein